MQRSVILTIGLLFSLSIMVLAGCSTKMEKGSTSHRLGAFEIDKDTLWKICHDVIEYRTRFYVTDDDFKDGYIGTDWDIEAGYGMWGETLRRRIDLYIEAEEGTGKERYHLRMRVEKQSNKDPHHVSMFDDIKWYKEDDDTNMEKRLLRNIFYRYRSVVENRELGLPDPEFGDIGID